MKMSLSKASYTSIAITMSLLLLLPGCSSLISATTDGPLQEDYGQRTWGATIDDQFIETKIDVNLNKASKPLQLAHINAISYNGAVLLTGQIETEALKRQAGAVAQKVRKVRRVHNELEVAGVISTLATINDGWITTKLKSKLLFNRKIQSSRLKIVTENGIVYLMGLVTHNEAQRTTHIARHVHGVRKVVKIFEYID